MCVESTYLIGSDIMLNCGLLKGDYPSNTVH